MDARILAGHRVLPPKLLQKPDQQVVFPFILCTHPVQMALERAAPHKLFQNLLVRL